MSAANELLSFVKSHIKSLDDKGLIKLSSRIISSQVPLDYFDQDVRLAITRYLGPRLTKEYYNDMNVRHSIPSDLHFLRCVDKEKAYFSNGKLERLPFSLANSRSIQNALNVLIVSKYKGNIPVDYTSEGCYNAYIDKETGNYVYIFSQRYIQSTDEIFLCMKHDVGEGSGFSVESISVEYGVKGPELVKYYHNDFSVDNRITHTMNKATDSSIRIPLDKVTNNVTFLRIDIKGKLDTRRDLFVLEDLPAFLRPVYKVMKVSSELYYNDQIDLTTCLTSIKKGFLSLPPYTE